MGDTVWLGNHEKKSDGTRPEWPVLLWLSSERGWILCDGHDYFLGITRVLAMMTTVSGMLVNSPDFNLHIHIKLDALSLGNTKPN